MSLQEGYRLDTIYKAVVNTNKGLYRIFFLFSYSAGVGKCINIGEGIYGGQWDVYHISTATEVCYRCPEGVWVLSFHEGKSPTWKFVQRDGYRFTPTISLVNEETRRNHYNTPAEAEVKKTIEWYEKYIKKEVKDKMLQLIDVIIFNRKTEVVDFREDIVAPDKTEASLMAVQAFGKYDPKIHKIERTCLLEFTEFKEK